MTKLGTLILPKLQEHHAKTHQRHFSLADIAKNNPGRSLYNQIFFKKII